MEKVKVWLKLVLDSVKQILLLLRLRDKTAKIVNLLQQAVRTLPYILLALLLLFLLNWIMLLVNRLNLTSKTVWDLMELLLVPAALAAAGFWFTNVQKNTELEIALDKQRQQTLENYLDRMKELLLDKQLGTKAEPETKSLARILTLNVLRELGAKHNQQIVQFLQEADLIGPKQVIDLRKANLTRVDLSETNLAAVNLAEANLKGINLVGANLTNSDLAKSDMENSKLMGANLVGANLVGAILKNADLEGANLKGADLAGADLEGANLTRTNFANARLIGSHLVRAKLKLTNLEGANLASSDLIVSFFEVPSLEIKRATLQAKMAGRNLVLGGNPINIEWARSTLREAESVQDIFAWAILSNDTIMPDGKTYLEWQQKREQSQKQLSGNI